MLKTTLSSRGQVVIPKSVRDSLNISPGSELTVEVTASSVILHLPTAKKGRKLRELAGALQYVGPRRTDAEIEAGIAARAAERWERSKL